MEVQRSSLLNGIRVAAAKPQGSQMGACTIMYQAGSRYEIDDELGATHFIRAASSATCRGYSTYAKTRFVAQQGGAITCTGDRQSIAFTLKCPVTKFPLLKNYLLDTAVRGLFHQWEINDLKRIVKDDLHRIHPEQRVIDLAQRACWGGPLSNSIFCEPDRVSGMLGDSLVSFTSRNFKTDQCTVTSVGIPFEETIKLAEMVEHRRELPPPRCEMCSFPRRGYETYDLGPNTTTWLCVVVPGCGTCDMNCLIKHAIIAEACGAGNTQTGQHSYDRMPLTPLALMAGDDLHTEYKAFNISYQETGVFGIVAKTRACSAWNVAMAASEFLTNVADLDFKQIEIGKRRLQLNLALHQEDCVNICEGLALAAANNAQIDSAKDAMTMVDSTCAADVRTAAACLSRKSCNMAFAVVGDVGIVPHEWELFRS
ncbi:cytochrome b-c1 complex subunit 2, mitochondrial-like [Anticarsia gemmatalis]|uniref:cytochrome b-c1 complex subunit 2, mitochondrial-like n=1 Tax=Anticarsia gemmatalis TaxID=129554 RepID=UPI003F76DD86